MYKLIIDWRWIKGQTWNIRAAELKFYVQLWIFHLAKAVLQNMILATLNLCILIGGSSFHWFLFYFIWKQSPMMEWPQLSWCSNCSPREERSSLVTFFFSLSLFCSFLSLSLCSSVWFCFLLIFFLVLVVCCVCLCHALSRLWTLPRYVVVPLPGHLTC